MANPKRLAITFSGICTLTPGYPRAGEPPPSEVFVLMSAARQPMPSATAGELIGRHYPFVYVPQANYLLKVDNVQRPTPRSFTVYDSQLGPCDVFLLDAHRLEIDQTDAMTPLAYEVGTDAIGETPEDIATATDIRWLPDMREIDPATELAPDTDPRKVADPDARQIAAVVKFTAGRITSRFPCRNAAKQVIRKADGSSLVRTFASEFVVTLDYPFDTDSVTIAVRGDGSGAPHDDLLLYWGSRDQLDIRMGNDTFDELVMLQKNSCTVPEGTPQADHDFELHYKISRNFTAVEVPKASGHEARHNGCLGLMIGSTGGGS